MPEAHELLTTVFSRRPFDLSALTSTTLVRYVTKRARRLRPGSVRVMALSLRSYLKFLRFTGEGRAAPPAECVNLFWSRSSLPATLAELQIVRLLGAFDCTRYSVIETAKANGLEPYAYLRRIIKDLPGAKTLEDMEALLPWNIDKTTLTDTC